jgi:hypothetical protein
MTPSASPTRTSSSSPTFTPTRSCAVCTSGCLVQSGLCGACGYVGPAYAAPCDACGCGICAPRFCSCSSGVSRCCGSGSCGDSACCVTPSKTPSATVSPTVSPTQSRSPCVAPMGSFCSGNVLLPCPAGTFASSTGSTSCQKCPGGHFCPAGTSTWAHLNCGRGNYCPDGSGAPSPCPFQVPPTGGWGDLQVQGPAFLVETAHCLNHCFWNFTSGDGMLSKC